MCALVVGVMCGNFATAGESLLLTRTAGSTTAYSDAGTTAVGGTDDYTSDYDADPDGASTHASAQSTNGGTNNGIADDYSDAVTSVALNGSSINPSVNVVTGGPMIVTNSATARSSGYGQAKGTYSIATPSNPYTVIVLAGQISISAQPGTNTTAFSTSVTVGGSHIYCTGSGCTGVIKDINAPGGQYTVSTPALGGVWNTSEYVTVNSTPSLDIWAMYGQFSTTSCSDWPDFNSYGYFTATAY